jgi:electron transfer flavoprotein beta subunit
MGKQAIDSDANQTGQLLAQALSIPQATFASKIELDWQTATVTREVDGGLETVRVSLPAVITTDLRLNEPRYPSLPGIVKAKKKPLDTLPITDLGVDASPKVSVVRMEIPAARKAGVKVSSVSELVEKLQNEAKVL